MGTVQNTAVGVANGANANALNANAQQATGGATTHSRRAGTSALDAVVAGLPVPVKPPTPRGEEYQEHSVVKIIVDLTAKVQPLCDELSEFYSFYIF